MRVPSSSLGGQSSVSQGSNHVQRVHVVEHVRFPDVTRESGTHGRVREAKRELRYVRQNRAHRNDPKECSKKSTRLIHTTLPSIQ